MNLGIQHRCAKFTHAFGGGVPSLHFIWKLPTDNYEEAELVQANTTVMDKLKGELPMYHTRAMRKAAVWSFGRMCGVKPAFMREIYRKLTGDASSSHDAAEAEVDEHVRLALDTEDPEVILQCPEGTPLPSEKWLLFQLWPKDVTRLAAYQYSGRLAVKFMIQSRQFRHHHIDAHYALALFR